MKDYLNMTVNSTVAKVQRPLSPIRPKTSLDEKSIQTQTFGFKSLSTANTNNSAKHSYNRVCSSLEN